MTQPHSAVSDLHSLVNIKCRRRVFVVCVCVCISMAGDCLGSVDGGQVEGEYSEWGCAPAVTGINM